MKTFTLVLGTHNLKKREELFLLLADCKIELKTLADFKNAIEVEETGQTFRENAVLKATEQARVLNQWVLGEDSGIGVEALDGAPGVYSARFSGPNATDQENNELLLDKLVGLPSEKRGAWYTCHMAIADPSGNVRAEAQGRCFGRMLTRPVGQSGFGYDPLFEIAEYHQTFGQLGDAVKKVLSHRARAHRKLLPQLLNLARLQAG